MTRVHVDVDLTSELLELAQVALAAFTFHEVRCAACAQMLDDRLSRVEKAMQRALAEVFACDGVGDLAEVASRDRVAGAA